jgi:Trp operon repressor
MGNMAPGERKHRREIQDTLGIPIATMNRLWKKLKTDGTPLNQAALDANIRVEERREGKTKRSYLLRD